MDINSKYGRYVLASMGCARAGVPVDQLLVRLAGKLGKSPDALRHLVSGKITIVEQGDDKQRLDDRARELSEVGLDCNVIAARDFAGLPRSSAADLNHEYKGRGSVELEGMAGRGIGSADEQRAVGGHAYSTAEDARESARSKDGVPIETGGLASRTVVSPSLYLGVLRNVCNRYRGCAKEYYIEPIPLDKANNARESIGIPKADEIVALIDLTVFGSASDAIVIAESGLYWRNSAGDPHSLSWSQFRNRSFQELHSFFSKRIDFGGGLAMSLAGAQELQAKGSHVAFELLADIKAGLQNAVPEPQSGKDSRESSSGLFACEFCGGKIKPDVTYCKFCGIKLRG